MLVLTGGLRGVTDLWFDPAADTLTANAGGVFWEGDSRRWQLGNPSRPAVVDWHRPQGDPRVELVRLNPDSRALNGYRLANGTEVEIPPGHYQQGRAILAVGERFTAVERPYRLAASAQCWLAVRSLADGSELARLPFPATNAEVRLAAVPHSARVAGTAAGRLLVYDCDAGTCQELPGRGRKRWQDLAAHPSGRLVAAVNNSPRVTFVDPHAATAAGTFDPGIGRLTAVACSPDGLLWAAAGAKGRVAVWDADG